MKKTFLSIALLSSAFVSACQVHLHAKIVLTRGNDSQVIEQNVEFKDTNSVVFTSKAGSITYSIANQTEESVEVTVAIAEVNNETGTLNELAAPVIVVAYDKAGEVTLGRENQETGEKESLSVTITAHKEVDEDNDSNDSNDRVEDNNTDNA